MVEKELHSWADRFGEILDAPQHLISNLELGVLPCVEGRLDGILIV